METFNVTLIKPDGYLHALALSEAAEYVHRNLERCGHRSTLTRNTITPGARNIVFCAHLLATMDEVERLPADTIIFNGEQLHNRRWMEFNPRYKAALERFYVWDYAIKNLPEIPHRNTFFIPFLFCPDLVRAHIPRTPGDTLYFYGAMTERRTALIEAIRKAGVPVDVLTDLYGDERDRRAFTAWAVLNLRVFDTGTTFEPIRCFYALTHGIPVITEPAPSDPTFDFYKDWVFAVDGDLAAGIAALYRARDTFARDAQEKVDAFRATDATASFAEAVEEYLSHLRA